MPKTPTTRSNEYARKRGWTSAVVEKWNPHVKIRQDLFGFGDILVIDDQQGSLIVQATSGSHVAARMTKIEENDVARVWLAADNRIEVWGWRKTKVKRGGKAMRWNVRRMYATLAGDWIYWTEVSDE